MFTAVDRSELSPWVDSRIHCSREVLKEKLDNIPGRRVLKSHLPLDALPYYPQVKYLIVCRDPRDVFMSLFNHYNAYTDATYERLRSEVHGQELIGGPIPTCPDDIHVLWRDWISKGWEEQDSEGYPYWPNMAHTESFWKFRDLPNFMFMHYADMLEDHAGCVIKLADFIELEVSEADVERVVERTTFAAAKTKALKLDEAGSTMFKTFTGGAQRFLNKGTNGRWKGVLSEKELEMYETTKSKVLSPACAQWLENGKKSWF